MKESYVSKYNSVFFLVKNGYSITDAIKKEKIRSESFYKEIGNYKRIELRTMAFRLRREKVDGALNSKIAEKEKKYKGKFFGKWLVGDFKYKKNGQ